MQAIRDRLKVYWRYQGVIYRRGVQVTFPVAAVLLYLLAIVAYGTPGAWFGWIAAIVGGAFIALLWQELFVMAGSLAVFGFILNLFEAAGR